ncbi:MAG: N-6 DNA methylase, partial [Nitrosotalea sp.]
LYETRILEGKVISSSGKLKISETNLLSLIKTIISLNESALIHENLIRDFCGANYDGVLFNVARILNNILAKKATQKTNMLMAEWGDLFSLAHNEQSQQSRIQTRKKILSALLKTKFSDSESESRALFALHTSYAIVLKLLAYRIISDIKFGAPLQNYKSLIAADSQALRSFCSDLEDGEIFRRLGILNLLEGDFFSWYCDKNQWNEDLAIALQEILEILGRYEDVSKIFSRKNAMDLFKELYEATVPQIVRATFGEFYTPFWLAQHVLEAASPKEKWRVIDPCCGSGTFIIAAMVKIREEMREQPKEEILKAALNRIAGVDLNPLAVLTTRVNFFIHIADLLPEQLENLVIPIFLGDSSYVPEKIEVDGVKVLRYKLRTLMSPIEIELPISLVSRGPEFVKLMYEYENLVKNEDLVKATELVLNAVNKQDRTEYIEKGILELTKQLVNLEKKKWNGIWARIITNFLTISCLGEFSCIIGNPPWIDWKNLPSGYREKIKSLCIDKGLFSGAGLTGGINLNVCALIAHVAINNWLTKDGKLAFLMPKELAYQ